VRFLLDTDSVSYALRGEGRVAEQIRTRRPSELGLSAVTLAELRFGAERRRSRRLHGLIDAFIGDVAVVPFDEETADRFGKLAAALVSKGTPIGALDTMIAAHALQLGLTLVTHNVEHFRRVRGLKLADWV
jgi:tRNA(fMet)-specific endonuclease VapC